MKRSLQWIVRTAIKSSQSRWMYRHTSGRFIRWNGHFCGDLKSENYSEINSYISCAYSSDCGKDFSTKGALKEHQIIHSDNYPFQCSFWWVEDWKISGFSRNFMKPVYFPSIQSQKVQKSSSVEDTRRHSQWDAVHLQYLWNFVEYEENFENAYGEEMKNEKLSELSGWGILLFYFAGCSQRSEKVQMPVLRIEL